MNHFPNGDVTGMFKNNGRQITLTVPFVYVDDGIVVRVPVGFCSDFNSVPRGLWNVFPPWEYPNAGIVHDWLYRYPGGRPRRAVDAIHRRILAIDGASRWFRVAAWLGIRAGGWKPWGEYRKAEAGVPPEIAA